MATPYATIRLGDVTSTQDEARSRALLGGEPVLVVATRQIQGRGRSGRTWWEAPRAMYSSLAFRPVWPTETWPRLALVAALAVRSALGRLTPTSPGLKWPNDLVTTTAGKLGGILTEAEGSLVVVGCGVNLWWPDPPPAVAAACSDDPGPDLGAALAATWADQLLAVTTSGPDQWGADVYRKACVTIGDDITWDPHGAGRAVDVDDLGRLVVETAVGRTTLSSGEVRSVRSTVAPNDGTSGDGTA